MSTVRNCEILARITPHGKPSIRELVDLFGGMLVKRYLKNFVRVINRRFNSSPLGVGGSESRFGPSIVVSRQFSSVAPKVIYGAQFLDTAIYETVVRGRFDINPERLLDRITYIGKSAVNFSTENLQHLNLLDLTNGKATCHGVPTDVIRSSDHKDGQYFSQFVYNNMQNIDGFIYSSRFTEEECVALYSDRVGTKLRPTSPIPLSKTAVEFAMLSKNIKVK